MEITMTTSAFATTRKSGRGMSHGVVSELSAFLTVKPGETEQLRAGLERFHARVRTAPWDYLVKIGIVDMRHIIFDNGTRLCWITAFDTDWDPYIDDAVAIIGQDSWVDWLRHTEGYNPVEFSTGAAIKAYLQAAQVPATGFFRAVPELTLGEVKKGERLRAAFEKVLDQPGALEALQQPVLKPLLDEAAS
jgi:hypothetical protein